MLPEMFQVFNAVADVAILIYVLVYFFKLRKKEKYLNRREHKIDNNYHQVVDTALSKERKILDDATDEAQEIITGASFVSEKTREEINDALRTLVLDVQQEAGEITHNFNITYANSLKELTAESLGEFQEVSKELQTDLEQQIKNFRETLLPNMEKELEEYKQKRLAEIEKSVTNIAQKVSQEVLNKTLSFSDHQNLVLDALEKAKREGVFD